MRQQASKHWQRTAAAGDSPPCQPSRQQSRKERSSGKTRELAGAREQRPIHPPQTTTSSHAATAAGSAARGSVSTATAGAAGSPQTDHGRNSIVSRDRRTPTINKPIKLYTDIGKDFTLGLLNLYCFFRHDILVFEIIISQFCPIHFLRFQDFIYKV